ncbi:MAG: sulfatase-like hydrolase/transferase [Spirochaetales bacterium]|nr:sulfatase-like hydrolase/transferase [Spirochaetales bacterium]
MSTSRPNIIFLLSDQHHAGVIGAAGDRHVATPHLDRLYRTGTSLTNAYCNAPLCVPSRSSMLSGLFPVRTGVQNNMQCLPSSLPTFVNSLGAAGYQTALSGRMHFVSWDQRHGFERRMVGDMTPTHPGIDNQAQLYGSLVRGPNQSRVAIEKSGAGSSAVLEYDEAVYREAARFVTERRDSRPLFLVVGSYGPHCPYVAPPELFDRYYRTLPRLELPENYRRRVHPAVQAWYRNRDIQDVTPEETHRVRAAYYGMVTYLDSLIGGFMNVVESTLDMNNTIVVYGSDHGDNIGEHGLFWKTNFYEGASRVPCVFRWDDRIEAGRAIRGVTSLVDLAPTFIDFAGAEPLPRYDGRSLADVLVNGGEPVKRDVFSFCSDIKGDSPSAMVRRDSFKLVVHAGYDAVQLFDLADDPQEYHDLGTDPAYQPIIRELRAALDNLWNEQDAIEALQRAKAEVSIMEQWARATNPEPVDEWYGTPSLNEITRRRPAPT